MALISTDPIIIDETGYQWDIYIQRQRVLDWTMENLASGNEAGGTIEQFLGNMAEHLLSMELTGLPIWEKERDGGWDYENSEGVRFDIKFCSNQYHAFMRYAQWLEIIDNHSLDELGDAFNEVQYTAQHW